MPVTQKRKSPIAPKLIAVCTAALIIISGVAYYNYSMLQRNAKQIPASIREELPFSPFIVDIDNETFQANNYKLSNVAKDAKLFSFILKASTYSLTISEYTQSQEFTEIPEFKERFLNNIINQTSTVQTSNGVIYIGKQEKQDNKQLGVMLERGLVVLMNPTNKELTQAQWRAVGEALEVQKVTF